jgi:hypothetical protein
MIDLAYFKSDKFLEESGIVVCGTYDGVLFLISRLDIVETYKRCLSSENSSKIEVFIEDLIKEHYNPEFHFPYEHTLIALAAILAEHETKVSEKFFNEVEQIHKKGGDRSLPYFIRAAVKLSKLRDELSSLKNKVRLAYPDAIFLPLLELKESANIIAANLEKDQIVLISRELAATPIKLSAFKSNPVCSEIDFTTCYLTDFGQTIGFGPFGTYEAAIDALIPA